MCVGFQKLIACEILTQHDGVSNLYMEFPTLKMTFLFYHKLLYSL